MSFSRYGERPRPRSGSGQAKARQVAPRGIPGTRMLQTEAMTSEMFCPPKPLLLDITAFNGTSRATFGT